MENEERRKGSPVLLTVLAVSTLLVAVIGATFAYFSITVSGNEDATSVYVKTATLGIVFDDGAAITGNNIVPSWSATKTFTVENDGEADMTFDLVWVGVNNTFAASEQNDLVYTVTGSGTPGTPGSKPETAAPTAAGTIMSVTIPAGATYTYTFKIEFKNTAVDQNSSQGKSFYGTLNVTNAVAVPAP